MKTLKTWEMYKIALENPKARFRRVRNGAICYVGEVPDVIFKEPGISTHVSISEEWELVKEPVDFMTAINSGKRIKPLYNEKMFNFNEPDFYMSCLNREYINGKWYIED